MLNNLYWLIRWEELQNIANDEAAKRSRSLHSVSSFFRAGSLIPLVPLKIQILQSPAASQ